MSSRFDILTAIYKKRGNHEHDGKRMGCFACTLIRELNLKRPKKSKV